VNSTPKSKPPLQLVADAAFASDMTPTEKLIALYIAWRMNRQTLEAFPSDATIARDTSYSARAVRAAVPSLRKARLLVVSRGGSMRGRRRKTTLYRLATAEASSTVMPPTAELGSQVKGARLRNYVPATAERASNDCGSTFHLTKEENQGIEPRDETKARRIEDVGQRMRRIA
jgi:hypothetical protein